MRPVALYFIPSCFSCGDGYFDAAKEEDHARRIARRVLERREPVRRPGRPLILVGNHWPSRSAGQYESEPFRIMAAETLAYWVERIHELHGDDVALVVLGDFNDEPFSRALTDYARSTASRDQVLRSRSHHLLNLMAPLAGAGLGSHHFDGRPCMLDQILISRGIVTGASGWKLAGDAVLEARELMARPNSGAPRRFGLGHGKNVDLKGYSDHFPVGVRLTGV